MKKKFLFCLLMLLSVMGVKAEMKQDATGAYLVTSPKDLQEFTLISRNGQANISAKLMADLDMTGINFLPIGLYADTGLGGQQVRFSGTFDGQGHVIRNLTIVLGDDDPHEVGLFSRCDGATLKNLGIVNATVESKRNIRAGVLGGEIYNSIVENCYVIGDISITTGKDQKGAIAGEAAGSTKIINCYTTYDVIATGCNGISNSYCGDEVAQMASTGELCYILNGDQSKITYYQTLGEDAYPVQDKTHSQVYATGALNCDGTAAGAVTYTNDSEAGSLPPHQYNEDGYCANCGAMSGIIEPTESGWYEVTNGDQLRYISRLVNSGKTGINVRIMNDIDLNEIAAFPPIGKYMDSDGNQRFNYAGTFDGQNHILYNLKVNVSDGQEAGLFGRMTGATLKNLGIVNASITNGANIRAGVFGGEIQSTAVNNCFSAGDIFISTEHHQKGGIAGEAHSSTLTDCYTTYDYICEDANVTRNHCFWGAEAQDGAESGELCYKLNNYEIENVTWYQTLGEDMFPVLDSTHGLVYKSGEEEYASAVTESDFAEMVNKMIEAEKANYDDVRATQSLIEAYLAQLDNLAGSDFKAFMKGYANLESMRDAVRKSESAYNAYIDKVAYVQKYLDTHTHDEFSGAGRDKLVTYLTENVEPGDLFPNGSYLYILDNLLLTTNQITAETTYVYQLLNDAIKTGYGPGAEITNLLVNGDFSQGAKGWDFTLGALNSSTSTPASETVKYIEYAPGKAVKFGQTLSGIANGVYEVRLGGYTEVYGISPLATYNYTGYVYANENKNYFETQLSSLQSQEMFDKYGSGNFAEKLNGEGEVAGYSPCSLNGVALAIENGYYDNRILVNVTDGELTIGAENYGLNGQDIRIYYGGAHLYYLGSMEQATYAMDEVLEGMVIRANHILEDYTFTDDMSYADAPNFNNSLKEGLKAAVTAYTTTIDPEGKYALISTFSDLFQKIRASKDAYIQLLDVAVDLYDAYYVLNASPEEQADMEVRYGNYFDMYNEGSASTEDVLALVESLKNDKYYLQRYGETPELVDGYYQLSTPYEVVGFAAIVNGGNRTVNAVLKNDIDMAEITNFNCIGNYQSGNGSVYTYGGTFDGQGHVIKNLNITREDGLEAGFFGRAQGATIKNLGIINANVANLAGIRAGVLGGELHQSNILNCFTTGELNVTTEHEQCAGFAGEAAESTVTNCYTTHDVFTNAAGTVSGCYYGEEARAKAPTGELAYSLNGNQTNIVWYQKIGEDQYPTLDSSRGQVYLVGEVNCGGQFIGETHFTNEATEFTRPDHQFDEDGICTVCGSDAGEVAIGEDGWYEVATPWNLRFIASLVNSDKNRNPKVRLISDIDLSVFSNFKPIGWYSDNYEKHPFGGSFDGQGHVIKNLSVSSDEKYELGLFGRASGATIKNLGVENATITNTNSDGKRMGVIGGEIHNSTVTNCWTTGNLVLNSTHLQKGGIAGEAANSNLSSCWTTYETFCYMGTKVNCYSQEDVEAMHASGELCYNLNNGNVVSPSWFQTLGLDEYPTLDNTHRIVYFEDGVYTNGASELAKYTGTEEDPFIIKDVKDMTDVIKYLVAGRVNYIKLDADLDMANVDNWTPLNSENAMVGELSYMNWINFDGQGHVISNFHATNPDTNYNSFFGVLCGACVNVGFENVDVNCVKTGSGVLGGYVGHGNFSGTTEVNHVYVKGGKLTVADSYCGGLFGNVGGDTHMVNCYANIDIESEAPYTGGLIGRVRGKLDMQDCYVAGTFNRGGGVVGGGQNGSTPASTFNNIVVWNNTYENFGTTAAGDELTNISYYNGKNFAELQQTVVGWNPAIWSVEGDNYPELIGTAGTSIQNIASQNAVTVYNLTGVKVKVAESVSGAMKNLPKGIYIVNGKKYLNK